MCSSSPTYACTDCCPSSTHSPFCSSRCVPHLSAVCARFLRCFKDSIPAALAKAFGEDPPVSAADVASMQPPPPQSPQVWGASIWSSDSSGSATTRSRVARTPVQVPSWLSTALGSTPAASPATPLLVRMCLVCLDSVFLCDARDVETGGKPETLLWRRRSSASWLEKVR